MEVLKRFAPFIVSLFWTPVALGLGIASAGAGHGNYLIAKVLFPYTMLSTVLYELITVPYIVVASVQYPIYGLFVSAFTRWKVGLVLLALLHVVFVILAFIYVGSNFS